MPLFDLVCPECGNVARDVLFRPGTARLFDCIHTDKNGQEIGVAMVRQLGIPAPAIFTSGGTGASRGAL